MTMQHTTDLTPVKDSPSLKFGPYRGKANWPGDHKECKNRVNFRFDELAVPGSARVFDAQLHMPIWCESEAKLPEATGIDDDDYSRFVTSHIDINYSSAPFQSHKVDLELRAHVGKTLPGHLYVVDELSDTDRTDPL